MELERTHPLAETIAVLRRGDQMERVLLRGLDREEVAALIEAVGGQPPPAAFVDAVHEVSEGNPFFVAEILRNLVESGAIRVEDGHYVGDPESRGRQPARARHPRRRRGVDARHAGGRGVR